MKHTNELRDALILLALTITLVIIANLARHAH